MLEKLDYSPEVADSYRGALEHLKMLAGSDVSNEEVALPHTPIACLVKGGFISESANKTRRIYESIKTLGHKRLAAMVRAHGREDRGNAQRVATPNVDMVPRSTIEEIASTQKDINDRLISIESMLFRMAFEKGAQ